jgi:hypothetical protein
LSDLEAGIRETLRLLVADLVDERLDLRLDRA